VTKLLNDAARADASELEAKTAREHAQQVALQYANKLKARNLAAVDKFYVGYLYYLATDYENAIATFKEILADKSLTEEERQRVRLYLIQALAETGRLKDGEAEVAAVPATAFNASEVLSGAHYQLAIAYTKAGQLDRAVTHQEQALQAARKSGIIPLISKTAWALSQLYVAVGRNQDAATMLTDSKDYFEHQTDLASGDSLQMLQRSASYIKSALDQLSMLGKPAPEIVTVKWLEDQPITLANLKGKVVALEFWAAWCPDCRGMIPHLREWATRYQKDGLKIVAVTRYYGFNGREAGKASKEEEETFLLHFKHMRHLSYAVALDDDQRSFNLYSVTWVPTIAVIDRSGRVRFVFTWHENPSLCETMIKKVLSEPTATVN
jgi:thiol-disulfide isomerase/thioredoxin